VGFDKVVDIVKTLLDQRVFKSELKAKIAFPELFQNSPARDVQRNGSENDAARSAAEALEELASASEHGGIGDHPEGNNISEGKLPWVLYITTREGPDYRNQHSNLLQRQSRLYIPPTFRIRSNILSLQ
jgi:hypothetical protein